MFRIRYSRLMCIFYATYSTDGIFIRHSLGRIYGHNYHCDSKAIANRAEEARVSSAFFFVTTKSSRHFSAQIKKMTCYVDSLTVDRGMLLGVRGLGGRRKAMRGAIVAALLVALVGECTRATRRPEGTSL